MDTLALNGLIVCQIPTVIVGKGKFDPDFIRNILSFLKMS